LIFSWQLSGSHPVIITRPFSILDWRCFPGGGHLNELAQEIIIDFDLADTIIIGLCQSLLALAARPRPRLSSMFVDQSNM
jgi:hypothetical protein